MPWRGDDDDTPLTNAGRSYNPAGTGEGHGRPRQQSMLQHWYEIVNDIVLEHGGDPMVNARVFHKHVRELRDDHYTDKMIRDGFRRFAVAPPAIPRDVLTYFSKS